jgi:hypothetical protein
LFRKHTQVRRKANGDRRIEEEIYLDTQCVQDKDTGQNCVFQAQPERRLRNQSRLG